MRLSTRGRFAINAMIDLAMRTHAAPVPLAELAQRHHISLSYLEQVFAKLRRHQLVDSTRGPGGGYTLGFRGDAISVADIVTAIDGDDADRELFRNDGGQGVPDMTHDLWNSLEYTLLAYMKTVSLRSLADQQIAKGVRVEERPPVKRGVFPATKPVALKPEVPGGAFALGAVWSAKT